MLAPVFTEPLVTAVPPFESYVIVRALADHWAYKVIAPNGDPGI